MEKPWLIVGLGNPGAKYEHTRHNLGARVIEAFHDTLKQKVFRDEPALAARVSEGTVILALPTTFMNASGEAVAALMRKFRTPIERVLIVHDDKDLAFGQLKLQQGRSAAGHHGVDSIIGALNSKAFWRLRVGIGAPPSHTETETFVLKPFSPEEESALRSESIPNAVSLLLEHVREEKRASRV